MWKLVLLLSLLPGAAFAQSCTLDFTIEITRGIGTYPPGTRLPGHAQFVIHDTVPQENEGTGHLATGEMVLDGTITGRIWALITTTGSPTADLVGIYADEVEGLTFLDQPYRGPMSLTLYGHSGTWPHDRPPLTQAEWDSLTLRRSFQLHAPEILDMLGGRVTALTANCLDSPPPQE